VHVLVLPAHVVDAVEVEAYPAEHEHTWQLVVGTEEKYPAGHDVAAPPDPSAQYVPGTHPIEQLAEHGCTTEKAVIVCVSYAAPPPP
jgi:hypothetical protein